MNSTGEIVLAGKIFDKIGLNLKSDRTLNDAEKQAILTMADLHIQGRTSFAEGDLVRKDPLIKKLESQIGLCTRNGKDLPGPTQKIVEIMLCQPWMRST